MLANRGTDTGPELAVRRAVHRRGLRYRVHRRISGLDTRVTAFLTDGVIKVNMTQNDAVKTFSPEPNAFGDERFPERLETRAGWNHPSCDEDWFRGFSQELSDFIACIRAGKQPLSSLQLAVDCVDVIYAAYVSAEQGRRVSLG